MKRLKKTAKPLKQHDRNRAIEGGRAISKSLGYIALVKACTAVPRCARRCTPTLKIKAVAKATAVAMKLAVVARLVGSA